MGKGYRFLGAPRNSLDFAIWATHRPEGLLQVQRLVRFIAGQPTPLPEIAGLNDQGLSTLISLHKAVSKI